MENIKKLVFSIYKKYEIITCISILEPWEKKIISKLIGYIFNLIYYFLFCRYNFSHNNFDVLDIIICVSSGLLIKP